MNIFIFDKTRQNGEEFILEKNESGFIIKKTQSKVGDDELEISNSSLEGYYCTTFSAIMSKIKKITEDYYDDLEVVSILYDETTKKFIESIVNKNKSKMQHKDEVDSKKRSNIKTKDNHKVKNSNKTK